MGGTVREDFWLNCKEKDEILNSLHYEFKIAMCQQCVHHLGTASGPGSRLSGGGGGGKWLGVGKEIWGALICAHLKFEFHPQGPRLLLWCWAISEYDQSYLTILDRMLINNYSPSLPHPIWIPREKIAVRKQGVDHLTFRKRKQAPPFTGFRQNLFCLKKKKKHLSNMSMYTQLECTRIDVLWLW